MSLPMTASDVLDREYLEIRAKILEIAASLDRLDRADGDVSTDPRTTKLRQGLDLLNGPHADRAEQVQLLFSRAYEDDWPQTYQLSLPR